MEIEMRKIFFLLLVATFLILSFSIASFADTSVPKKKQTDFGLIITALDAYTEWHTNPDKVKILDVRTTGEYIFVGHAPMATNIPFKFLKADMDLKKMKPIMPVNENFVDEVRKKFNETDTIMVMCRSGVRSAMSVNKLVKAGFKNVYNIVDGFEGNKINIPESYNNGKRLVNGWKNSGAPWTYELDPNLVYHP